MMTCRFTVELFNGTKGIVINDVPLDAKIHAMAALFGDGVQIEILSVRP